MTTIVGAQAAGPSKIKEEDIKEVFKLKEIKNFLFDVRINPYKWEYVSCQAQVIEWMEYLIKEKEKASGN